MYQPRAQAHAIRARHWQGRLVSRCRVHVVARTASMDGRWSGRRMGGVVSACSVWLSCCCQLASSQPDRGGRLGLGSILAAPGFSPSFHSSPSPNRCPGPRSSPSLPPLHHHYTYHPLVSAASSHPRFSLPLLACLQLRPAFVLRGVDSRLLLLLLVPAAFLHSAPRLSLISVSTYLPSPVCPALSCLPACPPTSLVLACLHISPPCSALILCLSLSRAAHYSTQTASQRPASAAMTPAQPASSSSISQLRRQWRQCSPRTVTRGAGRRSHAAQDILVRTSSTAAQPAATPSPSAR